MYRNVKCRRTVCRPSDPPASNLSEESVVEYVLDRLHSNLIVKHTQPDLISYRGVTLNLDNGKPPVSAITRQKLRCFGWKVLPTFPILLTWYQLTITYFVR
ncbi:hypothetical protein TNCV_3053401 [Trichonephila clavipes]|uniref:Uncharacterized protein n=1 Tax=Trichonephila clavipes TaxID=2585209 RepID=A0A8X6RRJ4_TRICX|nr:hypothetical protein TNCV_3053401 [Trichonephila clavipes]